jgi:transposase
MQLRKTKTDKKDAFVIAQFLRTNGDTLIQRVSLSLISDIRDLSRQRESLVDDMTALKMEIKRLLNITFPELEHMTGIFTKAILKLLLCYPSAHSLRGVDLDHLTQTLIADSQGHKRETFAEALLKAAQSSIGTRQPRKGYDPETEYNAASLSRRRPSRDNRYAD